MQKIITSLMFNTNAEEAVNFYLSIFKNSKINGIARYPDAGYGETGSVMVINFTLNDQEFIAINGGPNFTFTEAVSFTVHCKDQEEVDYYWDKLSAGGNEVMCGWLKDKFGVSWQIIPEKLMQLVQGNDRDKANKAVEAMNKMKKIIIKDLE